MKSIEEFDDKTWDRFFDFIYDHDDDSSDEEVAAQLKARGIDTSRAIQRIREALTRSAAARRSS